MLLIIVSKFMCYCVNKNISRYGVIKKTLRKLEVWLNMVDDRGKEGPSTNFTFNEIPSKTPLSGIKRRGLGDDEMPHADPCATAACSTSVIQKRRKTSTECQRDYRASLSSFR